MGPWCCYGELNNGKVYSSLCFLFSFLPPSAVASSPDFTGHHSGLLLNPTVWAQLVWACPEPCKGHMVPNCLGTARCLLLHGDGWGQAHCWLRSAPLTCPGKLLSLLFEDLQKSPQCCPQDPVPLTLVGTFLYLPLYIPLLKESYHHSSFLLCMQGFNILWRKRDVWKYSLHGGWQFTWGQHLHNCSRSEPTAWRGLHSMEWLGVGLPRRQVQPKLKIWLWMLWENTYFFKSMNISLLISVLWSFRTGRLI